MTYILDDADRLAREIEKALPGARIERWRDYGWAIDVTYRGQHLTACQPPRPDYQPEIFRSIDDVKAALDG